jgi:hypothetical protein
MAAAVAGALLAGCGPGADQEPAGSLDQRVAAFVAPTYVHGVPYDEARSLGAAAIPVLIQQLDAPAMAPNRSNILTTLGMIGSDAAADRLRLFLETGSGALPSEEAVLRFDALTAMGYAANVAAGSTTLAYLIGGLELPAWSARVKWTLAFGADPSVRLRQRSVAALGLSGKPEALTALQNLQKASGRAGGGGAGPRGGGRGRGGGGGPDLTPSEQAQLDGAIRSNQFVAANGLSAYYRTFRR